MKRGEMQKKFFDFFYRLLYFPFYRTKVKVSEKVSRYFSILDTLVSCNFEYLDTLLRIYLF